MVDYNQSNVNIAIDIMKEKIETLRDGRYTAKRGVISLEDLNWDSHPYVWGIIMDDLPIFRAEVGEMDINASFAVATQINATPNLMLDDGVLEEFRDDVAEVLLHLQASKLPSGDVVAMRVPLLKARAIQFHDTSYKIQGISVNFSFDV